MPFGRYCFNKLPFGITSAPEHFQKRMSAILEGLEGALCLMDNVLVFGKTKAEHDKRLFAVLQQIRKAGKKIFPSPLCELLSSKNAWTGVTSKKKLSRTLRLN